MAQSTADFERLSDADVLSEMLADRFRYAKSHRDGNYRHTFRKKTRWELVRLSLLIVGIECTYATETAFVAPILLEIGLPYTLMTMMWAAPPIFGLMFAPLIASVSDRLRSRWGKRRPVLLVLGLITLTGMLVLPNGSAIGEFLGLRSIGWIAAITTVGLVATDFTAETSNGLCRTYAMEVCTIQDQARVLSTMMLTGGLGGMMGYIFGAIDWSKLPISQYYGSNEAAVFSANWLVLGLGLLSTLTSFSEIPLSVQETNELLRPVTHKMLQDEMKRVSQGEEEVRQTEVNRALSFRRFVLNIVFMPRSMKILCLTQFLSHMGYLNYCLYFTDFVGAEVFHGDAAAPEGSPSSERYQEGVRFACWGMALFTLTASLYSTVIERMINRLGARTLYVGGLLTHSLGMLAMGFVREKYMVLLCCPLTGIMYATIYSLPFLIISYYHSKNSFDMVDGRHVEHSEPRGFGADVSMMSSMLCLAQLIVSMTIGAVIDAVGTSTVIIFASSAFTFCAAMAAMCVLYMEL